MENPNNKYDAMEKTLEAINRDFISLSKEETYRNNKILHELLNQIIEGCQQPNGSPQSNKLFCKLYRGFYFGGSFYEGLKIKKPDEYDIHVKLDFSTLSNYQIITSKKSGFVHLKFSRTKIDNPNVRLSNRRPYYGEEGLHALINNNDFIDSNKIMLWMHKILSTWLKGEKKRKTRVGQKNTTYGTLEVRLRRHGPAFTFRISCEAKDININFDFVPCFMFGEEKWPLGFRQIQGLEKKGFFIIPKSPNGRDIDKNELTQYLRTSFQEQDKEILNSKQRLKPALRLIKKLRDKFQLENILVSFFIKNLFLRDVYEESEEFWNFPLSYIFMNMLDKLQKQIEKGEIFYFWHRQFNLIEDTDEDKLNKMNKILKMIIINVNNNPQNKLLIAKYLLTRKEMKIFRKRNIDTNLQKLLEKLH